MSNQVSEWVYYGDGIGAVIVDYALYIWMVDEIKKDLDEWDIMNCVVVSVDLPHVNLIGLASLDISAFLFLLHKQTWNILH